ncbi:DinB family protein [Deinococcus sp. QL22]|uniref:DinB family protein n=1 Tax=Deinococcus sp. QL22 TaxID=2939437 RepID=UPI0020176BC3|nr:DinB family protein [Deinococcus sp. QL22]UQN05237.1 DinB family protein [Deinococcus sp. QL22]
MTVPTASPSRSALLARALHSHRAALMDLYAELPDDQAQFAAWEGGMSFVALADHLSGSSERFLGMVQGQAPGALPAPSADLPAARARLQQTTEAAMSAIAALGNEDLGRRVTAFGGREMPIAAMVDMLITHEAHHKGQVWMMARMIGVKPPMFVKMG